MQKYLDNLPKDVCFDGLLPQDLTAIGSRGLAHDHIKLGASGWILRIPRGNQLGLAADDYLGLQQEIYARMAPSKVTPAIKDTIAPNQDLPNGALIVEYIDGRAVQKQDDLLAVAQGLGKLHKMPMAANAAPLEVAAHPLAGQEFLLKDVFKNAFNNAALPSAVTRLLNDELQDVLGQIDIVKNSGQVPLSLIGGDSHLGNYLIDKQGKAWLVDLEFAAYDVPLVDLSDAILPITSYLDPQNPVHPNNKTRSAFYQAWANTVGQNIAVPLKPLVQLTERAVQLRTLAWLSYWQGEGRAQEKDKVPAESLKNWDAMVGKYLEAAALEKLIKHGAKNQPAPF